MRTDKRGRRLDDYPDRTDAGRLVGFNAFGNAVYATDAAVSLAILEDDGTLSVPPRTAFATHELPLSDLDLSPLEYVRFVADEHGPWRALAEPIAEAYADEGELDAVLRAEGADPETVRALVADLVAADDWGERAALAGELRLAVLDAPEAVERPGGDLLPLLDDVDGGRDVPPEADAAGTIDLDGSAEGPNFERVAARRDVAFALARAARASPEQVRDSLPAVLRIAGDEGFHDPATAYKRDLVEVVAVLARADPEATVAAVASGLGDADEAVRTRTLRTLTHLERSRHAAGDRLLSADPVRDRLAELADADGAVGRAAAELRMLRDFRE